MRCPRCGFEGALQEGGCARCGYGRSSGAAGALPIPLRPRPAAGRTDSSISRPLSLVSMPFLRGDFLRQGRYQLMEPLDLPRNQLGQGMAWLAIETQQPRRMVIIREARFPAGISATADEFIYAMALRLSELGRHPGFPMVLDAFRERSSYFLVLQYIEGTSLAQVVERGGTLSEQTAIAFGRQLCEMLSIMASFRPPVVHGSIQPQTVIVSSDRQRVSLIHFPLFPPRTAANDGRASEPAVDVYGLASTLYYALTGYQPEEHMTFFFPPARQLNPLISPQMESILARGLRASSALRYQRPLDMLIDLEAVPIVGDNRGAEARAPYRNNPSAEGRSVTAPQFIVGQQGDGQPPTKRDEGDAYTATAPSKPRRYARSLPIALIITSIVAIIVLLGGFLLTLPHGTAGPSKQEARATQTRIASARQATLQRAEAAEWSLELQSYQQRQTAISDGRFVFDTGLGRRDVALKMQAALALRKGDLASAISLLAQAVQIDPADGEAQIYYQDTLIAQQKLPAVTIVLGIGFDQNASLLGSERSDLQGALLAQRQINASRLLPHGLRLRLFIGGSGSSALPANAKTVAQFLANRVTKADNLDAIIAVVGWPTSAQTESALALLSALHMPIISQGAPVPSLSGSSPYFFRVVPPLDVVGSVLGTIAVQQMRTQTVLVVQDPNNPESASLAAEFTAQARTFNVTIINSPNDYIIQGATSVDGFQNVIGDVQAYNADLVVLAGTDVDAVRLAHAVGIAARNNPSNTVLAHLNILGGPAIDSTLLLGQGKGADAAMARAYPGDMQRLKFVAYADAGEYAFLHLSPDKQPALFSQWSALLQQATPPDQNAIVSYDAVMSVAKAAVTEASPLNGQSMQMALSSLGTGTFPLYAGASGRISFDAQGNPINKALVYLAVEQSGTGNVFRIQKVLGTFS